MCHAYISCIKGDMQHHNTTQYTLIHTHICICSVRIQLTLSIPWPSYYLYCLHPPPGVCWNNSDEWMQCTSRRPDAPSTEVGPLKKIWYHTPHCTLNSLRMQCGRFEVQFNKKLRQSILSAKTISLLHYTHAHIKLCNHGNKSRQTAKQWTCQQGRLIYMLITPPTVTNIHPIKSSSHPSGPHTVHQMEVFFFPQCSCIHWYIVSINTASLDVKFFSRLSLLIWKKNDRSSWLSTKQGLRKCSIINTMVTWHLINVINTALSWIITNHWLFSDNNLAP